MFRKFAKEFLIHSNKDDQYSPSIIKNPNLVDFAITWTNKAINATSARIILKHYNTTRNVENSDIDKEADLVAVNQDDFATKRMHSKIIYLANGKQLVTWCSDMQDGSGFGIYASLLEHSGSIIKEEFRVNAHVASNQEYPSVAPLANGDFIIVWHSLGQDTKQITSGIFAKVFDDAGEIVKEESQVNDYTANNQDHPVVASIDNGSYMIAWQSFGQDGSGRGVYAKIYDQNHFVIKEEFRVNSQTLNNQEFPVLSKLTDNKFIVVWQSNKQDGSGHGVYAKIYNSLGDTLKEEFIVNFYTEGHQKYPSVTLLSDESFIITWQSQNDDGGTGYNIYARKYSKEAIAFGEEFRVNDYVENNQENPQITALENGSCAIVWQSFGQDRYKSSIYGQILTNENNTIYETKINDQTTSGPTTSPAEVISTTEAPTAINTTPESTITPVTPVLETNTIRPDTTLAPTVAPSHADTTVPEVGTQVSTEQPTAAPTQIITATIEGTATTLESTSVADTTVVPRNTPTAIVTDAETQVSTEQPILPSQPPVSTLDSSTTAPQINSITEVKTDEAVAPSSTSVINTNAVTNSTNIPILAVTASAAPVSTNITSILLNASSTLPIHGSEAGNNFVITSNVKEATIIAGSGVDSFIFEPSSNSIVYIDNFGNNDLLNFSNVTNVTSYDALNKTSGSTHFHLPNNQIVVVKNKYPHELTDSNVALQNHLISDTGNIHSTPSPIMIGNLEKEQSTNNNITTSETNSNAVYLIAGATVGTVIVAGGITAGVIVGIMIYRHKKAVAAASTKIAETVAEHLPYGNEEDGTSSGVLSSSRDSSSIDMSGSMHEAEFLGQE
jgi:hypothetical protein